MTQIAVPQAQFAATTRRSSGPKPTNLDVGPIFAQRSKTSRTGKIVSCSCAITAQLEITGGGPTQKESRAASAQPEIGARTTCA